jgi:xylan 1,4-beta-xylosidase
MELKKHQLCIGLSALLFLIAGFNKEFKGIYLADPTIYLDKDIYYLYGTSGDDGFLVYHSTDLKNWKEPAGRTNGFALLKGDAFGSKGFWAPQVFKYNDIYYMAYTADEQIALAKSKHPLGPFKQHTLAPLSGSGKQIDPFIFFDSDGKPYIYYVKLHQGNRIYVSEMKPDLSDMIAGTARECISGTEPWENTEKTNWPVTEGPTVIKSGKHYYLIYSANDFRSKDYAVGYATSESPLGPWKKYTGNPIIYKEKLKSNGTGHGDLFMDKNRKYRYVMHTHHSPETVAPRRTGLIDLEFSEKNNTPALITAKRSSFRLLSQ